MVNERFYQGLTAAERKAVDEGVGKAVAIHRKMTSDQDKNAKAILEKVGMQVYVPTAAQIGEFRELAQPPVRQWAETEIGKNYVEDLFKAIDATRKWSERDRRTDARGRSIRRRRAAGRRDRRRLRLVRPGGGPPGRRRCAFRAAPGARQCRRGRRRGA